MTENLLLLSRKLSVSLHLQDVEEEALAPNGQRH